MKKTNITKFLLSLLMVFTITITNATISTYPQENDNHVQLFTENSPYSGPKEE